MSPAAAHVTQEMFDICQVQDRPLHMRIPSHMLPVTFRYVLEGVCSQSSPALARQDTRHTRGTPGARGHTLLDSGQPQYTQQRPAKGSLGTTENESAAYEESQHYKPHASWRGNGVRKLSWRLLVSRTYACTCPTESIAQQSSSNSRAVHHWVRQNIDGRARTRRTHPPAQPPVPHVGHFTLTNAVPGLNCQQ